MNRPTPAGPSGTSQAESVALSDLFVLAEQQLELTEKALLEQDADHLPAQSEALARAIQQFQRAYLAARPDEAAWQPRLKVFNARLGNLQKQSFARNSSVNRALTTLFPAEQGNAYARLGQPGRPRTGALPRVSNNTSYKA